MDIEKLNFIQKNLIQLLDGLPADKLGNWGKMNTQQMVEHLVSFFKLSTNKINFPLVTPLEQLPKFKAFLLSDKVLRENTKAPMLPEEPFDIVHPSMKEAVKELQNEIDYFIEYFTTATTNTTTQHPVFGDLNFDEWVLLHYKHVSHHARQFGLIQ